MFQIPIWVFALYFAIISVIFLFSCLGIYYLISDEYKFVPLILSATIFVAPLIYVAVVCRSIKSVLSVIAFWSVPVGYLGLFDSAPNSYLGFFFNDTVVNHRWLWLTIGVVLNYLAIFSVINSAHRILENIIS